MTWLDFGQFSLWPWPWIFKVKYGIGFISAQKMIRLPRNEKQTYWYEVCHISTKKKPNRFSRSDFGPAVFQLYEGQLTLNKMGSFMTMTVTFWWPRWGVRIYPIVTGVTSDVGVLSTRLVECSPGFGNSPAWKFSEFVIISGFFLLKSWNQNWLCIVFTFYLIGPWHT